MSAPDAASGDGLTRAGAQAVAESDCPANHTPHPEGYIQHAAWAERMLKTHKQSRCPTCGLWAIWTPKEKR